MVPIYYLKRPVTILFVQLKYNVFTSLVDVFGESKFQRDFVYYGVVAVDITASSQLMVKQNT